MGKWHFGLLAGAALAVAGCHPHNASQTAATQPGVTPAPTATLFKGIYQPASCAPADADVIGTINVVLPNNFNGGSSPRAVYEGPLVSKSDPGTGANGQNGFHPNKSGKSGLTPPFNVYVSNMGAPGQDQYELLRVMLTQGSQFEFYDNGTFFGLGGDDPANNVLCGASKPITVGNVQIATAYVDLGQLQHVGLGNAVPFTIALVADNKGSTALPTPILIDPMIVDNGGGTRQHPGGG